MYIKPRTNCPICDYKFSFKYNGSNSYMCENCNKYCFFISPLKNDDSFTYTMCVTHEKIDLFIDGNHDDYEILNIHYSEKELTHYEFRKIINSSINFENISNFNLIKEKLKLVNILD